jgi:hypothetical protein
MPQASVRHSIATDAANAIDDQEGLAGADHAADRLDVVAHAGAGFEQCGEHRHGVGVLFQQSGDLGRVEGFAPRNLISHDFNAERFADLPPSFGELARLEHDRPSSPRHEVHHRGFHRAGAGTGQHEHVVFGGEDVFQAQEDFGQQAAKLGRAVVAHLPSHAQQGRFGHFRRAGGHEAVFGHGDEMRARGQRPNNRLRFRTHRQICHSSSGPRSDPIASVSSKEIRSITQRIPPARAIRLRTAPPAASPIWVSNAATPNTTHNVIGKRTAATINDRTIRSGIMGRSMVEFHQSPQLC